MVCVAFTPYNRSRMADGNGAQANDILLQILGKLGALDTLVGEMREMKHEMREMKHEMRFMRTSMESGFEQLNHRIDSLIQGELRALDQRLQTVEQAVLPPPSKKRRPG